MKKMSFGLEVKKELCGDIKIKSCCALQELSALFMFSRRYDGKSFFFVTENETLVKRLEYLILKVTGKKIEVFFKKVAAGIKIEISDSSVHNAVRNNIELLNRGNLSDIECKDCSSAFIRGAFLTGGVVVDPAVRYELEYITNSQEACLLLKKVLEASGYIPKYIMRRSLHVVYFKSNEEIVDVLNIMGAVNGSMSILENIVIKNIKGNINRQINFENANIDKTVESARQQIEAIKKISEKVGLDSLPANLAETARIRLENAQLPMSELALLHSPQISKSGIYHRLNRIIEISRQL